MSNFNDAFSFVLQKEGYLSNVKEDKGGLTKYGLSQKYNPELDIRNLTLDEAKEVYRRKYWDKNKLEGIFNLSIATAAFDTVVNHGRGPWLIQEALNKSGVRVDLDGAIGKDTIRALNVVSEGRFASALYEVRKAYYEKLVRDDPTQKTFARGWENRITWLKTHIGQSLTSTILFAGFIYWIFKR